jgi:N-acetylglucosamine kinase-like BadF-type ATPase
MLIGIDAGGTSTRAAVLDRTGRSLGYGTGGGGNPVALGPALAGRGISDAVEMALRAARASGDDADDESDEGTAILAMAGASSFAAPGAMAAQVREISGAQQVEVVSDLFAMFASGTPRQRGYVLVSGTGAAALRIENDRVAAAADGLGWLLGDAGSGFWIGHRAVRAALGGLSGHGPATAMTAMLQDELGLSHSGERTPRGRFLSVELAIETFYQMQPIELAKFASLAFRAAKVADPQLSGQTVDAHFADDADPVAVKILVSARERLVRTLAAVRVPEITGPVILGGSVARRLPGLSAAVRQSAAADVRIVPDGLVGASVLALRKAGVAVDQDMFDRVTASLADIRRRRTP